MTHTTVRTFVDGVNRLWGSLLDEHTLLVALTPATLCPYGLAAVLQLAKLTQHILLPSQITQVLLLPKFHTLKYLVISGEQANMHFGQTIYCQIPAETVYQSLQSNDVLCAVLSDMIAPNQETVVLR